MSNYDNLFNTDEVPTHQSTAFTAPPQTSLPPQQPVHKPQQPLPPPPMNTQPSGLGGLIASIVVCMAIVLAIVYIPSNSNKPTVTVPNSNSSPNTDTKLPFSNSSKDSHDLVESETVKIKSQNESLQWVNYRKEARISEYNVLNYVLVADSPTLGYFEMALTNAEYNDLASAGIAPLIVKEVTIEDDSEIYYSDFKLHPQWRKLLEGNVN